MVTAGLVHRQKCFSTSIIPLYTGRTMYDIRASWEDVGRTTSPRGRDILRHTYGGFFSLGYPTTNRGFLQIPAADYIRAQSRTRTAVSFQSSYIKAHPMRILRTHNTRPYIACAYYARLGTHAIVLSVVTGVALLGFAALQMSPFRRTIRINGWDFAPRVYIIIHVNARRRVDGWEDAR